MRCTQGLPIAAVLAAACAAQAPPNTWHDRADRAQRALAASFWDEGDGLFAPAFPKGESAQPFHYWWQAHAIDVLIDEFERRGDRAALERAARVWAGVVAKNGGVTNDYHDDMLWMGLALLRLRAHGGGNADALRRDIDTLWQDVQAGWNDLQGGGIAWRKSRRDYKNTPANAPAVILGVRLHREFHRAGDLAFAQKVYEWLDAHLVDPETGFVADGVNREGDGRVDQDWAFTYNQGVRIGAAVELYRATAEARYLEAAGRTFRATLARLADEHGVLREAGRGDGALFKGILARYLGELAAADPHAAAAIGAFLRRQGDSAWAQLDAAARAGAAPPLFGASWQQAPAPPFALAAQLSAVMLLEQLARLEGGDRADADGRR